MFSLPVGALKDWLLYCMCVCLGQGLSSRVYVCLGMWWRMLVSLEAGMTPTCQEILPCWNIPLVLQAGHGSSVSLLCECFCITSSYKNQQSRLDVKLIKYHNAGTLRFDLRGYTREMCYKVQCFQSSAFLRKSAIFVLPGNFCTWFSNFRKKILKKNFFLLKIFFPWKKKNCTV